MGSLYSLDKLIHSIISTSWTYTGPSSNQAKPIINSHHILYANKRKCLGRAGGADLLSALEIPFSIWFKRTWQLYRIPMTRNKIIGYSTNSCSSIRNHPTVLSTTSSEYRGKPECHCLNAALAILCILTSFACCQQKVDNAWFHIMPSVWFCCFLSRLTHVAIIH